jgi:hypothetical protein
MFPVRAIKPAREMYRGFLEIYPFIILGYHPGNPCGREPGYRNAKGRPCGPYCVSAGIILVVRLVYPGVTIYTLMEETGDEVKILPGQVFCIEEDE